MKQITLSLNIHIQFYSFLKIATEDGHLVSLDGLAQLVSNLHLVQTNTIHMSLLMLA